MILELVGIILVIWMLVGMLIGISYFSAKLLVKIFGCAHKISHTMKCYQVIYQFLESLSLEEKITLFNKYSDRLEIIPATTTNYSNREVLTPLLRDFFDRYSSVRYNNEWEFSHNTIRLEHSEDNTYCVGQITFGSLCALRDYNTIFYEDSDIDIVEGVPEQTVYDFILLEVLTAQFTNRKDYKYIAQELESLRP